MTKTHTITITSHADKKTDTVEIFDDGPVFKVNLPASEGRDRVVDAVSKLAYVLWEKEL